MAGHDPNIGRNPDTATQFADFVRDHARKLENPPTPDQIAESRYLVEAAGQASLPFSMFPITEIRFAEGAEPDDDGLPSATNHYYTIQLFSGRDPAYWLECVPLSDRQFDVTNGADLELRKYWGDKYAAVVSNIEFMLDRLSLVDSQGYLVEMSD